MNLLLLNGEKIILVSYKVNNLDKKSNNINVFCKHCTCVVYTF